METRTLGKTGFQVSILGFGGIIVSSGVLDFLVKAFDIKPISTPEKDLVEILG
jgi:hydroxylamine reductase (hybrid-cluster protein)